MHSHLISRQQDQDTTQGTRNGCPPQVSLQTGLGTLFHQENYTGKEAAPGTCPRSPRLWLSKSEHCVCRGKEQSESLPLPKAGGPARLEALSTIAKLGGYLMNVGVDNRGRDKLGLKGNCEKGHSQN